jgi:hypothetical protein
LAHIAAFRAHEMSQHRPFSNLKVEHWKLNVESQKSQVPIGRKEFQHPTSNIQHPTSKDQGSSKEKDMTLHCYFFHPETYARLIHELV